MSDSNNLGMGIKAAANGDFKRASDYFSAAVRDEPANEEAWLYWGHCSDDLLQRRTCYQKVLELNPASDIARISLTKLELIQSSEITPSQDFSGKPEARTQATYRPEKAQKKRSWPKVILFSCLSLLLLGFLSVGFIVWRVLNPPYQPPMYLMQSNQQPTPPTDANTAAALRLMNNQDYVGAIKAWDQVIALNPQNDNAFYQRAICYYSLTNGQNAQDAYLSSLRSAANDLQQAIQLRPDNLDYLMFRRQILTDYAYSQVMRVDRDLLFNQAAKDGRKAMTLNLLLPQALYLKRQTAENLIEAGNCQEGLDLLKEVAEQTPTKDDFYGGVLMIESKGQACLGQLDLALQSIDASTFNGESLDQKAYLKALYLYQLGRNPEARQVLDQSIKRTPSFLGWRYYLRAVLELEAGDVDSARQDINTGTMYTWDRNGLYSYAQAKLALASGDEMNGIEWLKHAEATLTSNAIPLRQNILSELARLNATPLEPTPSVDFPGLDSLPPTP